MCMYGDGDYPDFFKTQKIKSARKEHKCSECGRVIAAKESYEKTTGKWGGNIYTFTQCNHCQIACNLLIKYCDGYVFGSVKEDIYEHINEVLPWSRDARRIYAGMSNKWKFNGKMLNIPKLKCG